MGIGVTQIRVFEGLKEVVIFGPGLGVGLPVMNCTKLGTVRDLAATWGPARQPQKRLSLRSRFRQSWPSAPGYGLRYLAPRSVLALWGGLSVAGQTDTEAEPHIHPSDATTAPDISLEIQIQHLKQQCYCR